MERPVTPSLWCTSCQILARWEETGVPGYLRLGQIRYLFSHMGHWKDSMLWLTEPFIPKACQATFAIWPPSSSLLPAEMCTERNLSRTKRGLMREAKRLNTKYARELPEWLALTASHWSVLQNLISKCGKEASWMETSLQVQVGFSRSYAESWEGKGLQLSNYPSPARAMPDASLGFHFHFT